MMRIILFSIAICCTGAVRRDDGGATLRGGFFGRKRPTLAEQWIDIEKAHLHALEPLREQVLDGKVVPSLGDKLTIVWKDTQQRLDALCAKSSSTEAQNFAKCISGHIRFVVEQQMQIIAWKELREYQKKVVRLLHASEDADAARVACSEALRESLRRFDASVKESLPQGATWFSESQRQRLQEGLQQVFEEGLSERGSPAVLRRDQASLFNALQVQQQQIQMLQQELAASQPSSPWNVAVAYRIPNTNLNLSARSEGTRASLQVSCVPDDSAPLLGSNGFVKGVFPGDLGISLNLSL